MEDPQRVRLTKLSWRGNFQQGDVFNFEYKVYYPSEVKSRPMLLAAVIDGQDVCEGGGCVEGGSCVLIYT